MIARSQAKQIRLFESVAEDAADVLALLRCFSASFTNFSFAMALRAMAFSDVPSTCDVSISDYFIPILRLATHNFGMMGSLARCASRLNRILRRSRLRIGDSSSSQPGGRNKAQIWRHDTLPRFLETISISLFQIRMLWPGRL